MGSKKKRNRTVTAVATKFDLACGANKREGFVGVDRVALPGVDIVADLEKYPWEFVKDGQAEELHCSHFVEHLTDMIAFMDECYRALKNGGRLTVIAPYYSSMRAWQDPTHKRAISEASFLYYNRSWRNHPENVQTVGHYPIKSDFDFTYGYAIAADWVNRAEDARSFAIRHYINVVNDIHVTLTKRGEAQ